MNDLRDRIADAIARAHGPVCGRALPGDAYDTLANFVMPIVVELAADLDHAERENRRITAELREN